MNKVEKLEIKGRSSTEIWDFENSFYWFSHPSRLNKMLAHYELFQTILELPGDVLELGVFKAASLIRFATFRNMLENDYSRKIVGFDAFGKFPKNNLKLGADAKFIDSFEKAGGDGLSKDEVVQILNFKGFKNIELISGNVFDTLAKYLSDYPETRIALLHLDMDVKEPTEYALEILYERVVPNGLIVFDDYTTVAGETEAVDEFLKKYKLQIFKSKHYKVPSYVRKPL